MGAGDFQPPTLSRSDPDRCPSCFETVAPDGHSELCAPCAALGAPHEALDLAVGTLVAGGRYAIGRVLGRGAFGVTYLAWDVQLRRRIAIKEFLPTDVAGRAPDGRTVRAHSHTQHTVLEYARTRFRQEARVVSQFNHANIIRILDFFPENGTEYMVMEYYAGETLAEYMDANGPIPETAAVGLMCIVLDALEEVHQPRDGKSHLHRDLKPSNIYLAAAGTALVPKLLDFGAARAAVGEATRNLTQVLTPGYAPFEQYHSRGKQGPWTDVYASAATLYHMVTGHRPAAAPDRFEGEALSNPRELVPEVSLAASTAILHGLELDREKRPQTAVGFRNLLLQSVSH